MSQLQTARFQLATLSRSLTLLPVQVSLLMLEPFDVPVSILRGVWGACLKHSAPKAYDGVFQGGAPGMPRYRWSASPDASNRFTLLLINASDAELAAALDAVWQASEAGFGPERVPASPDLVVGDATAAPAWADTLPFIGVHPLNLVDSSATLGDRLEILARTPLRLLRDKQLVSTPDAAGLAGSAWRRIAGLLPNARGEREHWKRCCRQLQRSVREGLESDWSGEVAANHRYSARQQKEVPLDGVRGTLRCKGEPAALASFAALMQLCQPLGIGKGTVNGLGDYELVLDAKDAEALD